MTLSAADATAAPRREPVVPSAWSTATRSLITLVLLALLGAVFLRASPRPSASRWRSSRSTSP